MSVVSAIGNECYAIKLNSQDNEKIVDWRLPLQLKSFSTEPIKLPENIKNKILFFMKETNLAFGCFDLIFTKEKEWVFLEINPMGQFLWVEEQCPELPLLGAFCHLLISVTPFKKKFLAYKDFLNQAKDYICNQQILNHVPAENNFLAFEI